MLHLDTRNQRREFAKDLVGFANTHGGFLVIGVEDATWNPVGIDPQQFDSERIENPIQKMNIENLRKAGHTKARVVTFEYSDKNSVRVTVRNVDELESHLDSRTRRTLFEGVSERLELETHPHSVFDENHVHVWLLID